MVLGLHKIGSYLAKNKEEQFIGTGAHEWCGIHLTIIGSPFTHSLVHSAAVHSAHV